MDFFLTFFFFFLCSLTPGKKYYYMYGDSTYGYSGEEVFTAAPKSGSDTTISVISFGGG